MSKTPSKLVKSDQNLKTPKKSNAAKTKTPSSKGVNRKSTSEISATGSACETPVEIFLEDAGDEKDGSAHNGRRRSNRIRYPNKQFTTDFLVNTGERTPSNRKRILPQNEETDTENEEAEDTEDGSDIMAGNVSKPKLADLKLLEEDVEMAGKLVFGFNTPKKKGRMAEVAMNTPKTPGNTPKTPKTPSALCKTPESKRAKRTVLPKTPSHLRNKVKTQIAKLMADSGSDFSADDSEFSPSESESSSSDCETSEADNDVDDEPKTPRKRRKPIIVPILPKTPSAARLRQSSRNKKNTDFVPECESYFQSHSSNKIFTSDHTLDRLKNPRLPADRLFSLLSKMKISSEHEDSINAIMEEYKSYFPKWLYILNEGFNILLYGLGSKRQLLQSFHRSVLSNQPVIVINGFFPSLTIKDILDSITNDILDADICSSNPHEAVDMIEEEFSLIPQTHLYLIVHNLEGTMLRSSKAQSILARLAKVPNIHMLASVDHINTPLLWDHTKLSNFNFSWWDCTTMLPYSDETAFENSLLVQNSGELALSSMRSVFSALTTNARGIYLIIVRHQLKNKGNTNYQGISFQDLYWRCREAFLVSSDLALRAQLTEFLDHKLAKSKRSVDGNEQLTIPIDAGLLQQFLDEHEK